MASSKHEIEMDFRAAKNQAKRIDDIASRLNKISQTEYRNTLQQIAGAWKGENGERYINKCDYLVRRMNNTVSNLRQAADTIRRIAQNTYNAEMRAWEIAHRKDY